MFSQNYQASSELSANKTDSKYKLDDPLEALGPLVKSVKNR